MNKRIKLTWILTLEEGRREEERERQTLNKNTHRRCSVSCMQDLWWSEGLHQGTSWGNGFTRSSETLQGESLKPSWLCPCNVLCPLFSLDSDLSSTGAVGTRKILLCSRTGHLWPTLVCHKLSSGLLLVTMDMQVNVFDALLSATLHASL